MEMIKEQALSCGGSLKIYSSPETAKGCVLILPGGAYQWLSPRESEPVARAFFEGGWTPVILSYTCWQGTALGKLPMQQAGEALEVLKECFPGRFAAVCGFSAGGHLAASLGTCWKREGLPKPDGLVLCYPVITAGGYAHQGSIDCIAGEGDRELWSLEKQVTEDTPPTFLWHTMEDRSVPYQNSVLFYEALAEHGVPAEMHLYPYGMHGLSLATPEVEEPAKNRWADPHVAGWMNLCLNWLGMMAEKCSGSKTEK